MKQGKQWEIRALQALLLFYVILCLIIAGLNYGYAPKAPENMKKLFETVWHIYENEFKTFLILICGILTLRVSAKQGRNIMRRRNLVGFFISALAIHIIGPRLLANPDLYFFAMPAPWTTTAWQLMDPSAPFTLSRFPLWGAAGISALLIFFLAINLFVFVGTLLAGRRLQCSMVCLFNGFAAEIFAPVMPLSGASPQVRGRLRKALSVLKYIMLAVALFYTLYWALRAAGINILPQKTGALIAALETWKYLLMELLMAMFFWVAVGGRAYCHYCPLGTVLGYLSIPAGQRIRSDLKDCIACGKCDKACPMGISIRERAQEGKAIIDVNCVGCGRCVDVCPVQTLEYSTHFYALLQKKGGKADAEK